jgi:LysM repeat protein
MARRRLSGEFLVKIGLVVLFLFYAWSFGSGVDASGQISEGSFQTIQVARGDTVWSIAGRYVGEKDDIRNVVIAIKKLNNLGNDVAIYPGQSLKVPVKK